MPDPIPFSRRAFLAGLAATGAALAAQTTPAPLQAQHNPGLAMQTRIRFFGHSAFSILTPTGKHILIDPWIINPANPDGAEQIAGMDKVDAILITHAHADHIGQAVQIAKRTGARLCSVSDTARAIARYLGYPEQLVNIQNLGSIGGTIPLLDGDIHVTFTQAFHGSSLELPEADGRAREVITAGVASGMVVQVKDGPAIYHTGDTDLFTDMEHIRWFLPRIDYMLCCIGDRFTMGPDKAAYACRLVNPRTVIPMHYGTFPLLTGTPEMFAKRLLHEGIPTSRMKQLTVGEALFASAPDPDLPEMPEDMPEEGQETE